MIPETKTTTIADLLEDALIDQLSSSDPENMPTAAVLSVARQYLRDQGFVAMKRPNARFHDIADRIENYVDSVHVPFPSDDEAAAS